ncbi:TniQ family protein [Streptomyces sp. H10-C2]|uniref:TniQ family protein n=1 Tax=unclassified Streptomyces TaxID=2593676 RepID=UPI0024B8D6DB|nr:MULTISPECIES: TniQ family protein [unclassified Streptomyces]MDJ0340438.1 TniQ family protein [Streptomyces sp. PH10-H1]MDJ0368114.1 TniQ family protein [Streptomyces sp. H10-C2]
MSRLDLGLPRRLALVVEPLPGEALLSWLNIMSAEHGGLPRLRTAQITGVLAGDESRHALGTGSALYYPHAAKVARMRAAAALTELQVTNMLWHRFRGTALYPFGPQWVKETSRTSLLKWWIDPNALRLCPRCVDESGGRWLLAWQLPWVFVCLTHRCYLVGACPVCGRAFTAHGTNPLHGAPHYPPLVNGMRQRQCGARLRELPAVPAQDDELLALQQRLWDALHAPAEGHAESFGLFQDLWAMACLALFTAHPEDLSGADTVVREAFAAFCRTHDGAAGRRFTASELRTPPVLVQTAVIRTAARIVFAEDPLAVADTVAGLSRDPHSAAIIALRKAWNVRPLFLVTRHTTARIKAVMDVADYSGSGHAPPPKRRSRTTTFATDLGER